MACRANHARPTVSPTKSSQTSADSCVYVSMERLQNNVRHSSCTYSKKKLFSERRKTEPRTLLFPNYQQHQRSTCPATRTQEPCVLPSSRRSSTASQQQLPSVHTGQHPNPLTSRSLCPRLWQVSQFSRSSVRDI